MGSSGPSDRSKEAAGMMALHEALRNVCLTSDWTYSVFWTVRPRPRSRGGNGCKVGDESGSLMLMWEDGFCRPRMGDCMDQMEGEDPVRRAFSKMSIQLYNYGEGLMGKVASDKCHKWVFKEPSECEPNISNYWQSSFDALPSEWTDQFNSGIQTIAVIQAGHGLLQLGSCKIIPEDLHFVLRMRHTFESLGYQSGFYLSQLFSSARNTSTPSSAVAKQMHSALVPRQPAPIFSWGQSMIPSVASTSHHGHGDTHLFLFPQSVPVQEIHQDDDPELKWPNGLSFFNALTGRVDESKLLFAADGHQHSQLQLHSFQHPNLCIGDGKAGSESLSLNETESKAASASEYLSLESHATNGRKMEHKFKRSFTLPARMASSASSSSLDNSQRKPLEEYGDSAGMYSNVLGPFMG